MLIARSGRFDPTGFGLTTTLSPLRTNLPNPPSASTAASDAASAARAARDYVRRTPVHGVTALPKDKSKDLAASPRGGQAMRVAKDAAHFSATEEAFFKAGSTLAQQPRAPVESFDDLDEGYQPRTFWQRLFNKPATRKGDKGAPKK